MTPRMVLKFGGSSVATPERMRHVARRVARFRRDGYDVAVVVSAMGDTTDELLSLAAKVAPGRADLRELDQLLATGEQQSVALLALALGAEGVLARSLTGPQWGLRAAGRHGMGLVESVDPKAVCRAFDEGAVVVAAGFQGLDAKGDVMTLGRGGSDLSAIALAAALDARACSIYTDVVGLYSADPRRVPGARKIDRLGCDLCLEMTVAGAKVLQSRCVELAAQLKVPLYLASSMTEGQGSWIMNDVKEKAAVVAVVDQPGWARLVVGCDDEVHFLSLLGGFSDSGVAPLEFTWHDGRAEVWTLEGSLPAALETVKRWNAVLRESRSGLGKLTVVGPGLGNHGELSSRIPRLLASVGLYPLRLTVGGNSVALWIDGGRLDEGLRFLHQKLIEEGLGGGEGCPCPSL